MSKPIVINPLFNPKDIIHGSRVSLKRCHYTGHCLALPSEANAVDVAVAVIDYIGKKFDSEDCLPFIVFIAGNENLLMAEDNGEISCGDVLSSCLETHKVSQSIVLCVSRYVEGAFVSDMFEGQKRRFVKMAATSALQAMLERQTQKSSILSPSIADLSVDSHDEFGIKAIPIKQINLSEVQVSTKYAQYNTSIAELPNLNSRNISTPFK